MEPCTYVVFGATGDLAQRKIVPALFALYQKQLLHPQVQIICFSRRTWSTEAYRAFIGPAIAGEPNAVESFLARIEYAYGTFDDHQSFIHLRQQIQNKTVFYHLAIQPVFYETAIASLGESGQRGNLLIEKPFAHDLATAIALEKHIEKYFAPTSIFLIDHYLGKEGLAALLHERMHHHELEKRLQATCVSEIHIRFFESIDVGERGAFYDTTGALRDVGQNHMLEMLATLLAPLAPTQSIAASRAQALASLTVSAQTLIRGQYEGYRAIAEVDPDSVTETYFKVVAYSTDAHWKGVPIILEAGKALPEKHSDIVVSFKDGTSKIFDMETPKTQDAYEAVIAGALSGDRTTFVSREEMLAAWRFITPLLQQKATNPLLIYTKGVFPK